jgi:hypothetical protein
MPMRRRLAHRYITVAGLSLGRPEIFRLVIHLFQKIALVF